MKRKEGEENIRKLVRLGATSLAVTLPKALLASLGWREKQRLSVKRIPRGILLRDFRNK